MAHWLMASLSMIRLMQPSGGIVHAEGSHVTMNVICMMDVTSAIGDGGNIRVLLMIHDEGLGDRYTYGNSNANGDDMKMKF